MRVLLIALGLVCATACGADSPTAPSIVQVGGVWAATDRLTSAAGGECVGPTVASISLGVAQPYSIQLTQTGSNLTAIVTNQGTGVTTNYAGTAGVSTITLNATFSTAATIFGYRCTNGALRDVNFTNGTVTATISGNTGSGTDAQSYNVFIAGTQTAVGVMALNGSFSMTRQ